MTHVRACEVQHRGEENASPLSGGEKTVASREGHRKACQVLEVGDVGPDHFPQGIEETGREPNLGPRPLEPQTAAATSGSLTSTSPRT